MSSASTLDQLLERAVCAALDTWKSLPEDERNGDRPFIQGFNAGWNEALSTPPAEHLAVGDADQGVRIARLENTLNLSHHYWLEAAKEALQGDLGKLRRHVAISEGRTREDVIADMGTPPPPLAESVGVEVILERELRWQVEADSYCRTLEQMRGDGSMNFVEAMLRSASRIMVEMRAALTSHPKPAGLSASNKEGV